MYQTGTPEWDITARDRAPTSTAHSADPPRTNVSMFPWRLALEVEMPLSLLNVICNAAANQKPREMCDFNMAAQGGWDVPGGVKGPLV